MNTILNRIYNLFRRNSNSNSNNKQCSSSSFEQIPPVSSIPHCYLCGHPLTWDSDLCRSDVGLVPDDLTTEEALRRDSVIELWSCSHCGTHYEITLPSKNEVEEHGYASLHLGNED